MNADFWNDRYSVDDYIFGTEPNEYFKTKIVNFKSGKILVPAAGEGRDAVFAAGLGWDVVAFDLSEVGKKKAQKLASSKNLKINYKILDVNEFKIKENEYDAIVLSYFHLPENIRTEFYLKICKSLKKGGIIILESFNPLQLNNNSGGPKEVELLMTSKILAKEFKELDIIENKEVEITLNEGGGHVGKANVVRFLGKKI